MFHKTYEASRNQFRRMASENGWHLETMALPTASSSDHSLAADIAYYGVASPQKLLVIVSGVHGVELMCGSGCQASMIAGDVLAKTPPEIGVLMIHAINPWGAMHLRRTNESNIDLCRNCLDFSSPPPVNPAYAELHQLLCSPQLDLVLAALDQHMQAHGELQMMQLLMAGQHCHSDGFNFGGHKQSWSTRSLLDVLKHYSHQASEIAIIELHSGLGEYAKGMIVCMQSGAALNRARSWFGPNLVAPRGTAEAPSGRAAHQAPGHTTDGYARVVDKAQLTSVVLEFGTYDMRRNFEALVKDHWLSCVAPAGYEDAHAIKQEMLHVHLPDDPHWQSAVIESSTAVVAHALRGLTQS